VGRTLGSAACGLVVLVAVAGCGMGHESQLTQPPVSSKASAPAPITSSSHVVTKVSTTVSIHAVNWSHVRVPGATCGVPKPLRLNKGMAVVPYPGNTDPSLKVIVEKLPKVSYGNLNGAGQDEAALGIECTTTAGTVDGEIEYSWVVYSVDSGVLKVIGTLQPQQPATAAKKAQHVPYFDGGPKFGPSTITLKELWYTGDDATCCPSVKATTVWRDEDGVMKATSTTH
jgi:hypothetical protein